MHLFLNYYNDTLARLLLCCFFVFLLTGLRVPPSCELVVGGEPQCWSEGSCLLFDDSFLHRAFHEGKKALKFNLGLGCVILFILKEDWPNSIQQLR